MRKTYLITLIISVFVFLLASCKDTVSNETSDVFMLRPHEEWPQDLDADACFKVFLAGTIDMGNSVDWQRQTFDYFKGMDRTCVLFNPRQEHWDASREGEMDFQVNWELEHLEQSDCIIMNILGNSQSPISLLEMGLFARSGKLLVSCEKDFYRYDNVRITCQRYQIPLYDNLDDLLEANFADKKVKSAFNP